MGDDHNTTIEHLEFSYSWDVTCSCGFEVSGISTSEAAEDTANWHQGKRSLIEDVTGIAWAPDDALAGREQNHSSSADEWHIELSEGNSEACDCDEFPWHGCPVHGVLADHADQAGREQNPDG